MAKYGGYYLKISGIEVLEGKTMVFMVNEAYKKLKTVDALGKTIRRNYVRQQYSDCITKYLCIQRVCKKYIDIKRKKIKRLKF
jgi:hypothetical protein